MPDEEIRFEQGGAPPRLVRSGKWDKQRQLVSELPIGIWGKFVLHSEEALHSLRGSVRALGKNFTSWKPQTQIDGLELWIRRVLVTAETEEEEEEE